MNNINKKIESVNKSTQDLTELLIEIKNTLNDLKNKIKNNEIKNNEKTEFEILWEEIYENFDFEKAASVYKFLNWRWFLKISDNDDYVNDYCYVNDDFVNNDYGYNLQIPTKEKLIEESRVLCKKAYDNAQHNLSGESTVSTGGLSASYIKKYKHLKLEFIVCDYDTKIIED